MLTLRDWTLPVHAWIVDHFMKVLTILGLLATTASALAAPATPAQKDVPTFNRDVAPILFAHCIRCHRPGGAATFPLTSFRETKTRAQLIARVTNTHFMPPWLPEAGYAAFQEENRLSDVEIATLAAWVKTGTREGDKKDLPEVPIFKSDWQLGTPDLLLTLPVAYQLPAAGPDIYRNFVIPSGILENHFVRALELRAGTSAIHHAIIQIDTTGDAKRLESEQDQPGFPGMRAGRGARNPGHFLSWQPGRPPSEVPSGMAWLLPKNADLVLQIHLRCTGKAETVRPKIALYFTTEAPTRPNTILLLRSTAIDIPAGKAAYSIESSYQLPVDAKLVGLLPHMHYLGKEIHGWAELPDGTNCELLLIKRWDFNWQSDYRYRDPIPLPKGTVIHMSAKYDNSSQNARNPHQPPQRVQYGVQTSDEMGELWFWMETATTADLATLERHYFSTWGMNDNIAVNEALLRRNPKDAEIRTELAVAKSYLGQTDEAISELQRAIADNAKLPRTQYVLGTLLTKLGRLHEAEVALEAAVQLDPTDANAFCNLGTVEFRQGKKAEAATHFQRALVLDPNDQIALNGLIEAQVLRAP